MIAVLRSAAAEPVLTTHRLPASPAIASAGSPLQRLLITSDDPQVAAKNADAASPACLMISPTRDWLAVAAPNAADGELLRAAIAGVRIGGLSARNSPSMEPTEAVLAAATGPSDELVLVTETNATDAAPAGNILSMHATPGGWELLRLETGLRKIRDLAATSPSGTLFVITDAVDTATPPQPAGLWQLATVLRDRRPAITPLLVCPLERPQALAAGRDEVLYAAVDDGHRLLEIRPASPATVPTP